MEFSLEQYEEQYKKALQGTENPDFIYGVCPICKEPFYAQRYGNYAICDHMVEKIEEWRKK